MQAPKNKLKTHSRRAWPIFLAALGLCLLLTACSSNPTPDLNVVQVVIHDLDSTIRLSIPSGATVQTALEKAGTTLSDLDRVEPPTFTPITNPTDIKIFRVTEEFQVEEKVIPFDHQTVQNESLPEGQQLLVQPGVNGLQLLTYRRVLENGVEVSRSLFKSDVSIEAIPEILMIGIQAPFTPVPIPGRLVYLSGGNAWLIETDTGNRTPLITSGDLDGRVFNLSGDGDFLLFTRKSGQSTSESINSLWVLNLDLDSGEPANLGIENVTHFADWIPGIPQTFAYSTVEPRSTAPGWQANNNLHTAVVGADGLLLEDEEVIETNSGGIYGWWGTEFVWSPDGTQLAYTRPDSVGTVDLEKWTFIPLLELAPYQTGGDWAWVPGLTWSADNTLLYLVTHKPAAISPNVSNSPFFNLTSISLPAGIPIDLVQQTGMFSYPQFSPSADDEPYRLAYLEAVFPEQSGTSRYRLVIIDQDGSNRTVIFPPEGSIGLEPQKVEWSPSRQPEQPRYIAYIYQGNVWLIDSETSSTRQVTGDGLASRIDWE